MEFIPIKTRPILPPQDDIFAIFDTYIQDIKEGDIIFVTSKIVAIHQGRCIDKNSGITKEELIKQEAEKIVVSDVVPGKGIYLTIKENTLIASAGIDESNANGYYILRPNELAKITKQIREYFRKRFTINNLGIILTDSTSIPLRWGVMGISIYGYGIELLIDKRGTEDIFGKKLEITQINIMDALSAMAVYQMGEGNECTPIVIGRNIPNLTYTLEDSYHKMKIPMDMDLYKPLLSCFNS